MTTATVNTSPHSGGSLHARRNWIRFGIFSRNFLISAVCLGTFFIAYAAVWDRFERLRMESAASRTIDEQAQSIRNVLKSVGSDLTFLARMPALNRFIADNFSMASRQEIETIFEEAARENPYLDRIAYIDRDGKERIRVERAWGDAWVTPERYLRDLSAESYFTETRFQSPNHAYLTPLDFDREGGRIVEPRRLVMSLALPVADSIGSYAGTIAITIRGSDITAPFEPIGEPLSGYAILLDHVGRRLAGTDLARIAPANFQSKIDILADAEPELWDTIASSGTGQVWRGNTLYRFSTIVPSRDAQPLLRATTFDAVARQDAKPWHILNVSAIDTGSLVARPENLTLMGILLAASFLISWGVSGTQYARKIAERRTRQIDRRMRDILNNIQASVQVRDLRGRFIMTNHTLSRHTGVPESQLIGAKLRDVFNDETARLAEEIDERAWRDANSTEPREVKYPSGNTFLINSFPLYDDAGAPEAVCTTGVDITQLKATEDALVAARKAADDANQAKSRFLASMSHEFRTPMNAIIGYSEMLAEDAEADGLENYAEDLRRILSASRHLLSLINDVLDLSKIEAGRMELFVEEFRFDTFLGDIVATTRPFVEKNGNQFIVDVAGAPLQIKNDATRLRQIILNLLSNAAKFTKNGTVTLRVSTSVVDGRDFLDVSVSDTGIGMDDQQLAHLFQDYNQAHTDNAKAGEGTGLGLNISKSLARMMAGDIVVESSAGAGAKFTLRVPRDVVNDTNAFQPTKPAYDSVADLAARTGPILVIDDEADAREIISRFLVREGFEVITATNGEEGLLRARQIHPAAITLDVFMEDSSGWDILQRIGDDPDLRHIPVIMCTIADARGRALSLGAVECLVKPINRETLLQSISSAVASKQVPLSILAVDDDEVNRRQFSRHLSEAGHKVIGAENGSEALRILEGGLTPDVILLDLVMPTMDGFQFLREVRSGTRWENIPIIVVTSKTLSATEKSELAERAQSIVERSGMKIDDVLKTIKFQILARTDRSMVPSSQSMEATVT